MSVEKFSFRSRLKAPQSAVAGFHFRPLALERLTPPFDRALRIGSPSPLENGMEAELEVRIGPARERLIAAHRDVSDSGFVDEQKKGPFKSWVHQHRFVDLGPEETLLEEEITFSLPYGPASAPALPYVKRRMARTFRYRHDVTAGDLTAQAGQAPLRIALTGATGLIGSAMIPYLNTGGHEVVALRRPESTRSLPEGWAQAIPWSADEGGPLEALEGFDAVVHLAGENVVGRWNKERKKKIEESRTHSTRHLAEALAQLRKPPRVLVSASGVGFYGDTGETLCAEDAPSGDTFLASVCRGWEAATAPAAQAGIRVVHVRIGLALDAKGGALGQMVPAFAAGVGGPLGEGNQYISWISMDDLLDVFFRALTEERLCGPVNAVTDRALPQAEFASILGRVLRRPSIVAAPAFALKARFGEMAKETVLASSRVNPAVLLELDHKFRHPRLELALRHVLGR